LAIGQGEILVTPVQLAVCTGAIATGLLVKPRIAHFMTNPSTGEVRKVVGEYRPVKLSSWTLQRLREAMRRVVNEPGGTAYRQRRDDIVIAGKTGTAQNPHGEDHALFIAYAPLDDPIVVGVAVVEKGGHGSSVAAPIVCQLIEYYLYDLYPGPRPPYGKAGDQISHQSQDELQGIGVNGELIE
ncbi:MAG: penicillin-binding transpeptidase domain-containing protein, partial [bacterium]